MQFCRRKRAFVISCDGAPGGVTRSRSTRESTAEVTTSQSFAAVRPDRPCGRVSAACPADDRPGARPPPHHRLLVVQQRPEPQRRAVATREAFDGWFERFIRRGLRELAASPSYIALSIIHLGMLTKTLCDGANRHLPHRFSHNTLFVEAKGVSSKCHVPPHSSSRERSELGTDCPLRERRRRSQGRSGVKVFLYDGHFVRREHVDRVSTDQATPSGMERSVPGTDLVLIWLAQIAANRERNSAVECHNSHWARLAGWRVGGLECRRAISAWHQ
jgi:hypothetical protein